MNEYLGTLACFAFDFAPSGWAKCDGQLLPISSYTALYSLLGTHYGGDGKTTFGLPDLRGRVLVHEGQGPGLAGRKIGAHFGEESVSLTIAQMPKHSHTGTTFTSSDPADSSKSNNIIGSSNIYATTAHAATNVSQPPGSIVIAEAGGGAAHDNMQPSLVCNWCICIAGIYPSKT